MKVTLRRTNGDIIATGTIRPTEATPNTVTRLYNKAERCQPKRTIGTWEHIPGGNTYHCQLGYWIPKCNGCSLDPMIVVQTQQEGSIA
uniref:Uncharacterized protein n=1 Tax=viral metagenome TaxID=1070528 RepID=A0A6M3JLP6_9ZZZZ